MATRDSRDFFPDDAPVTVVTDVATPLGAAAARRAAGKRIHLVAGGTPGQKTDDAETEILRVRALHRIVELPVVLRETIAAEGARRVLETAVQKFGRIDTIVAVAQPEREIPAVAMAPLMSMLRCSLDVLAAQRSGQLILALDSTAAVRPLPPIGQARLEAAFESLIQTTMRAHRGDNIRINGISVEPRNDIRSTDYMLTTGSFGNGHAAYNYLNTATSVISMLCGPDGQSTVGKLFRVNTPQKTSQLRHPGALPEHCRSSS